MVSEKLYNMQTIFHHFINNSWTFESKASLHLIELMSEEEKVTFNFDLKKMSWKKSLDGFAYGLRRFFMKEDCLSPEMNFDQILPKNQISLFNDVRTAKDTTRFLKTQDNAVYFTSIMS